MQLQESDSFISLCEVEKFSSHREHPANGWNALTPSPSWTNKEAIVCAYGVHNLTFY